MFPAPASPALLAAALLAAAAPASAQLLEGGARSVALGRAGVAAGEDAWADANPAAWATVAGRCVEAFASQAFGLPELRVAAIAAALPTPAATLAAGARVHGPQDYREMRLSAGVARTLPLAPARRMAVGVRADLHTIAIGGFGSTATADLTAGVQADILPSLRAGLAARNLAGIARADSADLRVPLSAGPALLAGLAFRPSGSSLLLLAWEKELEYAPVVRAGFEFTPVGALSLRAGASTSARGVPARLSFGAGLRAGRARVDVAVEWHEVLGASPAFGVGFRP